MILAGWILLVWAGPRTGARVASDIAPVAVEQPVATMAAPPPVSWHTGRVAGPGLRNRPTGVVRIPVGGPVQGLLTDGTRVFVLAGGVVTMVRSDKVVWTQDLQATRIALLSDGLWVSRAEESVRLEVGTGAVAYRETAGGTMASAIEPLGDSGRVWQNRDGSIYTSAGWFLAGGSSPSMALATDGETVYAGNLDGGVLAADAQGVTWRATLPAAATFGPMLGKDQVFFPVGAGAGQAGGLVAFDRKGVIQWKVRAALSPSAPLAAGPEAEGGDTVYLGDRTGAVTAYDAATGAVRWELELGGAVTAMTVQDDVILTGAADGVLSAVERADGGERWRVNVGIVTVAPVITEGRIWVGTGEGVVVGMGG